MGENKSESETLDMKNGEMGNGGGERVEIDTSAPFQSVKQAVTRFGGIGYWKPSSQKPTQSSEDVEEVDVEKLEEQAAQLEKALIVKERETLDVLKELESTKTLVEDLKIKMQKETSEITATLATNTHDGNVTPVVDEAEKENRCDNVQQKKAGGLNALPSSAPGLVLMELKQAKLNLTKATNDLTDVRASVESFNRKLERERISLEKTRERLSQNFSKISSLEEELNQTKQKLQSAKDAENSSGADSPSAITRELHRLSSEAEQYKKVGEAAKLEVQRALYEIEHTRGRITTAETRLIAAIKMKEAARAAEALALAEIKALSNNVYPSGDITKDSEGVTLTYEEYSSLANEAREVEEQTNNTVADAMLKVDEANISKMEILKKVEKATEEVKTSKKALAEALDRVEAANQGKLAVEEALRRWRSENVRKRRAVQNTTKFKNSYPSHSRRESRHIELSGPDLVNEGSVPILKPTLSIGQILSRKLLLAEEYELGTLTRKGTAKKKVSLGQMLGKQNGDVPSFPQKSERESSRMKFSSKRKKFGFAKISLPLLAKQSKKKKQC